MAVLGAVLFVAAACGSSDDSNDATSEGSEADTAESDDGHDHEHGDHEDHDMDDGWAELAGDHEHEMDAEPLDAATQELLDAQLADARELAAQYPTVADAEADGWRRAGPFAPGLGTHFLKVGSSFTIRSSVDSEEGQQVQPMLMFDGHEPDDPIVGFMMLSMGEQEPEGFAGSNDHWHQHTNVCLSQSEDGLEAPFGADRDDVTEEMCTEVGGSFLNVTTYMVHVWAVEEYQPEAGVFGGVSEEITCPDGTYHELAPEELDGAELETTCLD